MPWVSRMRPRPWSVGRRSEGLVEGGQRGVEQGEYECDEFVVAHGCASCSGGLVAVRAERFLDVGKRCRRQAVVLADDVAHGFEPAVEDSAGEGRGPLRSRDGCARAT